MLYEKLKNILPLDSSNIIFCDIEADKKTKKIQELGLLHKKKELKTSSILKSSAFIKLCLYVGMTRAKEELCILRYGNDIISKKDYVEYLIDNSLYPNENKIFTHIMSLQDISLGFDVEKYAQNNSIMSGYKVMVDKKNNFNNLCVILNSRVIGTFSKLFQDIINQKLNNGFMFNDIVIDNVVMWFDKDNSKYLKHALCKITMKKMEKNKCCKQN